MQPVEDFDDTLATLGKELGFLGLPRYEARAYVALVALGYGDVETIARTAKIPRTSGYKALEGIVKKGFAISTSGRPKIYKPVPPEDVLKGVRRRVDEIFERLDGLHGMMSETGEPQLIYTLSDRSKVVEKIREILNMSTSTFVISAPSISFLREIFPREIQKAQSRKVAIKTITSPMQRPIDGAEMYRKEGLMAIDIISDGMMALVAAPDLSACGYTRNEFLAEHMERFIMEAATRVSSG